ncbi:DUF4149 domain-containing protein [Rubrobacter calidifluminis]|uniref:DUF4149 domain-containing protein n=1 Tax=Rubrobacter calidifluminis TaxID=1392640 RepID=UPI0023611383|nr:DUF4149 domain-containing protein [Rubrobacter calidifluminis]
MLDAVTHTVHVLLAGVWLGGVVFTTTVVSPALKAMKWPDAERIGVRSVIGGYYARVGTLNLLLLLFFAVLDGIFGGFGGFLYAEYALLVILFFLVVSHGAYFGRRLRELAEAEEKADDRREAAEISGRRRSLQRLSFAVSVADILVSVIVVILSVNAL